MYVFGQIPEHPGQRWGITFTFVCTCPCTVAINIRIETFLAGETWWPLPQGFNTSVFPNLRSVFDVSITGIGIDLLLTPLTTDITTLGLRNLIQVPGRLSIIASPLRDLRAFSSLRCGPGQLAGSITIVQNGRLTSLEGLNGLVGPPPDSPIPVQKLNVSGNTNLFGPRAFEGLRGWLQCSRNPPNRTAISTVAVQHITAFNGGEIINNVDTLCQKLSDGNLIG